MYAFVCVCICVCACACVILFSFVCARVLSFNFERKGGGGCSFRSFVMRSSAIVRAFIREPAQVPHQDDETGERDVMRINGLPILICTTK